MTVMSNTSEITLPATRTPAAADVTAVRYALIITNDGELVENSVHKSPEARRDACVKALKASDRGDVDEAEVTAILAEYNGSDPDGAIGDISPLYAEHGYDIYLEDQSAAETAVAGVPVALHSILQSFENSNQNTLVHFPTAADREAALRRHLSNIGAAPAETKVKLTENELATRLENKLNLLLDQKVTVHLATSFVPIWAS